MLAVGDEGKDHVELLRTVSHGEISLLHGSHQLPLLDLIEVEDVVLGVFPKAGGCLSHVYGSWAESSVGDILDIIAQCMEVSCSRAVSMAARTHNVLVSRLLAFHAYRSSSK